MNPRRVLAGPMGTLANPASEGDHPGVFQWFDRFMALLPGISTRFVHDGRRPTDCDLPDLRWPGAVRPPFGAAAPSRWGVRYPPPRPCSPSRPSGTHGRLRSFGTVRGRSGIVGHVRLPPLLEGRPGHVRNTCAGGARRSDLDSDGPAEREWNRVGGPPARPHHEPWLGMASAVRPGKPRGRDLDLLAPSRTSTLGSGGNRVHLGGGPFARKGRESRGIPCPELLSRGPVRAGIRWGHPSDAGIETFPELRRGGGPERDPHGSW